MKKNGRSPGDYGREIGDQHFRLIRQFFSTHLCATQKECAEQLNLSIMAVNRHVKRIRAEWKE